MKYLGEKIKDLREERLLSSERLAQELGFTKSTMLAYENGKKQVTVSHLSIIADFFDVSVDFLLDRKEKVIALDLQNVAIRNMCNLTLDDQLLDIDEIAAFASYIQVKRRMGS